MVILTHAPVSSLFKTMILTLFFFQEKKSQLVLHSGRPITLFFLFHLFRNVTLKYQIKATGKKESLIINSNIFKHFLIYCPIFQFVLIKHKNHLEI